MRAYAVASLLVLAISLPAAAATAGVTVKIAGVPSGERVNVGVSYSGTHGPVFQSFASRDGSGTLSFSVPSNAARVGIEASASAGKRHCKLSQQFSSPPHEVRFDFATECKR